MIVDEKYEISTPFRAILSEWVCCSTKKQTGGIKAWHKKCHREAPMAEEVGELQQCIIASKGKHWYNRM